jgi:glycosyltransferase involved in cell wall biosynthesis
MIFAAACLFTDRVVAVCEKAREVFAKHPLVPAGKLEVIYNGIPLASYLSVAPRRPGGDCVFGVVGRMVPVKDHESLLKAFSIVARQRDDCRMEFLGDGVLRRQLERTAASLGIAGRVHFHGERPADGSFYEGIDVFVLSSLSEGLPMTVLEAMASARPVVSTAVGGVPELVEGARAGWLCPPGNVAALSNALLDALRPDTHREMGERAREYVRNRGSVEAMVTGYENLFLKLLGEQTPPVAH